MPTLEAPDGSPLVPESLVKAAEERTRVPQAPEPVEVVTAFTIYTLPDGRTMVTLDLDAPLVPQRQPTSDDLFAMASIVVKDVVNTEQAQMAANAVVGFQEQRMRQVMEAQQNAQLQQKLEADKRKLAGRR